MLDVFRSEFVAPVNRQIEGRLHHVAARIAGTQVLAAVEFAEPRQEVLLNVGEFEVGVVQLVVALVAEPHQPVLHGRAFAFPFDDQAERTRLAHRAVRHTGRVQVHVARVELHVDGLAIFGYGR